MKYWLSVSIFIILALLPSFTFGQSERKELFSSYGLVYGANSARINFQDERQQARVSQFFGFELDYKLRERFFLSGMALYAPKTSSLGGSIVVKKNSFDFIIAPTYKVDDITLKAGVAIEQVSSISSRNITSTTVQAPISSETLGTDVNAYVSAEVQLSHRFNFFVQSSIPTNSRASSSVGMGLKFKMNQKRERQISDRERIKKEGIRQINRLKEGVLLVRLKTSQNKIKALEKVGLKERALQTAEHQKQQNLKIVNAFRKHYAFSEVQFFYSHNTKTVKEKNLKNIFLDDSLNIDSSIKIQEKPYLIAEYAQIEQDTARFYSHSELEIVGNFQAVMVDRYEGSTNFGFRALVIRNENFEQMVEPFPYYSRFSYQRLRKQPEEALFIFPLVATLITPSFDDAVKKLNWKLNKYYLWNQTD